MLRELAESSSPAWVRGSRWLGAWLRQALWYSGCVTAIGLPLVWHQFHVVSPISVITNVCMSVPLAIALASGIATVLTVPLRDACGRTRFRVRPELGADARNDSLLRFSSRWSRLATLTANLARDRFLHRDRIVTGDAPTSVDAYRTICLDRLLDDPSLVRVDSPCTDGRWHGFANQNRSDVH